MESPMKLSRSEKDRRRREKLKSENAELYREKLDLRNENARRQYLNLKESNPDEFKRQRDLKNKMARMRRNQKLDLNFKRN